MIKIIDSHCGSGKTTSVINLINLSEPEQRFFFVTPLLSECERIIAKCEIKDFKQPTWEGQKGGTSQRTYFSWGKYLLLP